MRLPPEGYDVDCLQTGAYLGAYMGMAKAGSVCTNNNNNNNNNNLKTDVNFPTNKVSDTTGGKIGQWCDIAEF